MKTDIHPKNHRLVIFHDNSSGDRFLISSTIKTDKTDKWEDGTEYPVTFIDVSSSSHPFYTGQEKVMDAAGRVEKFKARIKKAGTKKKS
jgi:large subunit ribosomal protein L31